MRILVKWYFNELLGYLLMSFTSISVIDNDKNKPECIFSSIEMFFLYIETATKRKQNNSIFKSCDLKETLYW